MQEQLLKQLRQLRIINAALLVALVGLLLTSFAGKKTSGTFGEINVERINVVEKDGSVKLVITNRERQPLPVVNGVAMDGRGKAPGILFYNDEGDECGGLLFSGDQDEAGQILTFDQYDQDQIMTLRYNESRFGNKPERLYGLSVSDRPDTVTADRAFLRRKQLETVGDERARAEALRRYDASGVYGHNRLFVGKVWNGSVGVYLNDRSGNKRARLYVDSTDQAKLEFYDAAGTVIDAFPR